MLLHKIVAFIKRDFFIQTSYKLFFILTWLGMFISVLTFYFISKLFGEGAVHYLKDYGGQYFPFVLVGIAFSNYLAAALGSFSANLRQEQMTGTLEAMLVTPTGIPTIIISMSLWNFIFSSITVILYLLFGVLFFKVNLAAANFLAAFIILLLTIISFASIGIISAAFIMIFKRGDPITWLIGTSSVLFGGVYFPVTVLPKGLQIISHFFPITYCLRALRHALLQGYSFKLLVFDIMVLLFFSVLLLPLSIMIFKFAIKKARIDGSLAHY